MAMPRAPGTVGHLSRDSTVLYRGRSTMGPWWVPGAKIEDAKWSEEYITFQSQLSLRPSYSYGTVITFPNGFKFRKATNYSIEGWSVGEESPAYCNGASYGFLREAYDHGKDGSLFISGYPRLVQGIPTDGRNEAVTKALNDIANQKANVGENLATLSQTLGLFTGKTKSLVDLLKAMKDDRTMRKYVFKSYRDLVREGVPKRISRLYLEYIYGFAPLMSDIYGLAEMAKEQGLNPLLLSGKANAQRTVFKDEVPMGAASNSIQTRVGWKSDLTVKCGLTAQISPEYGGLRSLNQLGLLNPVALAWELVPWSFVVDWVLPIGAVLNAMSAPAGLTFVDGWVSCKNTEKHRIKYKISWAEQFFSGDNFGVSLPGYFPVSYEAYTREAFSTWPLPGLWFDQDPLRGQRGFQALALAIQNLGKSKSR